ncbi:MucBP domain-containing protein [Breznakia pachnodae]|uniref:MucBP domain-containing protein n=1 Tax=Breznakia pachnodae TaxID=265178 RepID=A0ABU0E1B1_9FIRM|nr:MucBP domain-containing protein [Breznakia pachnodae]MDQ0360667.1 hypothetical protein [Breznakia pachnodae]
MKKKSIFLAISAIALSLVVGIFPNNVVAEEEEAIVVNDENFDSTINNPAVTAISWDKYQEVGHDMAFTSAQSGLLGDGSDEHIQLIGNEVKFFGYYSNPYLDFLYYTESDASAKEFTFSISQDQMDWHTINSVGFFVNCVKNTDGTYSGYYFSLESYRIALRKMDHFDLEGNHVLGGSSLIYSCPVVYSQPIPTGSNDTYTVKLKSEETKFSVEVTRTASDSSVSMINFDLDLATATSDQVPTGYTGGNDFGIYSAYNSHYCSSLSYATFSDITILSKTTREVGEVNVEFIDYTTLGDTNMSVKDTMTADGYEGQNFTVNPPATIGDYVYVGSSLDANTGTYTTNPQSVQLYYVHPKYTVEHVDENGKVLSTETFDKGLGLQEYKAKAKSFDSYKLSGAESQSVTLTKDNPDQKMIFVYKKQTKAATKTSASVAPATGDSTNVAAMMLLGGLSLLSIVVIKIKKQRA